MINNAVSRIGPMIISSNLEFTGKGFNPFKRIPMLIKSCIMSKARLTRFPISTSIIIQYLPTIAPYMPFVKSSVWHGEG